MSLGEVEDCRLICSYHGWAYDGDGRVVDIPHDLFGHDMPKLRVPAYPVKLRYGLIWIFPGDPALAEDQPLPEIPELECDRPWPQVALDVTWNAHHSMIIDNVSDFTHAHLHRKYRPFSAAKLVAHETVGDDVRLKYDAKVGRGPVSGLFVDHGRVDTNRMELCYQYPYQWSNTDEEIKHWLFVLPIDERTTRSFFIFYFKSLKVPLLPVPLRGRMLQLVLNLTKGSVIKPLLSQDGVAVEAEQEGYERHWDDQFAELNPVVRAFQEVTARKWQEHLNSHPEKRRTQNAETAEPVASDR